MGVPIGEVGMAFPAYIIPLIVHSIYGQSRGVVLDRRVIRRPAVSEIVRARDALTSDRWVFKDGRGLLRYLILGRSV